ncbi:unnamed protein product [Brassicogethes aeneus]|uniref:DUF4806 domain-containing protein n=1 Tax=Brassicogethes aeneus TaxID=1431903 RepID=A0A9P0BA74_BRAAE|nr:unnamed protein product [Brassicogethes aeneus]
MATLPIHTIERFLKFNRLLLAKEYLEQTAIRLKDLVVTSNSLKKSVRILMERVAIYDVYENFSWSGKSGILNDNVTKLVFSDLEGIINLVMVTIKMKCEEPRENVVKALKDFCKRSSQNKKRVEDKQRKAEENV